MRRGKIRHGMRAGGKPVQIPPPKPTTSSSFSSAPKAESSSTCSSDNISTRPPGVIAVDKHNRLLPTASEEVVAQYSLDFGDDTDAAQSAPLSLAPAEVTAAMTSPGASIPVALHHAPATAGAQFSRQAEMANLEELRQRHGPTVLSLQKLFAEQNSVCVQLCTIAEGPEKEQLQQQQKKIERQILQQLEDIMGTRNAEQQQVQEQAATFSNLAFIRFYELLVSADVGHDLAAALFDLLKPFIAAGELESVLSQVLHLIKKRHYLVEEYMAAEKIKPEHVDNIMKAKVLHEACQHPELKQLAAIALATDGHILQPRAATELAKTLRAGAIRHQSFLDRLAQRGTRAFNHKNPIADESQFEDIKRSFDKRANVARQDEGATLTVRNSIPIIQQLEGAVEQLSRLMRQSAVHNLPPATAVTCGLRRGRPDGPNAPSIEDYPARLQGRVGPVNHSENAMPSQNHCTKRAKH